MTIYVRFVGEDGKHGFNNGESYSIKVIGMTIFSSQVVVHYNSIQEFLEDWSFIDTDFMSDLQC